MDNAGRLVDVIISANADVTISVDGHMKHVGNQLNLIFHKCETRAQLSQSNH